MSSNFVKIAWFGLHFGEEPPLVGDKPARNASPAKHADASHTGWHSDAGGGAGTIFFTGCNLACVFCQNWQISQKNVGKEYSVKELTEIMLKLQKDGALNIDLVSPTIWAKQIKEAIIEAKKRGLTIPVVWNSNGYEKVEILKEMEGLVDIYLPDFKYGDDDLAFKYSGVKNYVSVAQNAIREMLRQVGNLKINDSPVGLCPREQGIAKKGIIIRHMILPNNIENSFKVLKYISEIDPNGASKNIFVHLMSQYEPVYKAKDFPEVNRNINKKELEKVFDYLTQLGFGNGWVQDLESHAVFLPDFTKENPFRDKTS